jgi:crotonobetainyl-CoA:carnitine CoA-transferase CaiB-like acyl-CoA transferase
VISVENAEGAWQRHWSGGNIFPDGQSALHLCANRNKRSVAIDLKSAKGREIALRLADTADVVGRIAAPA